jgi:hypothetical protein
MHLNDSYRQASSQLDILLTSKYYTLIHVRYLILPGLDGLRRKYEGLTMLSLAAMEAWRAANLAALELASTAAVATVSFLKNKTKLIVLLKKKLSESVIPIRIDLALWQLKPADPNHQPKRQWAVRIHIILRYRF